MFDPEVDYYEILQVHPKAHLEVIKRAYRTIVKLLHAHPDLGGSHEDAVRVNEAYEVLSNPELRAAYDAARRQRHSPAMQMRTSPSHGGRSASAPPSAGRPAHPRPRAARPPANGAGLQTVYCPRCGARNRLPRDAELHQAICGKCHALLAGPQHAAGAGILLPGEITLTPTLRARLAARSELRLHRAQLPTDKRLHCLRCHYEWIEITAPTLPTTCPNCRSRRWSDFRLFQCRHCQHEFCLDNLNFWPYWFFPVCPSCQQAHWHQGCERHPLRWLLNRLNQLGHI